MSSVLFRLALVSLALVHLPGCGDSSPTEPAPSCSFTLSAASLALGAGGGTSTISVSTTAGCSWTAASDRAWMTIASGSTGIGSGTVTVAVSANEAVEARSGALTVAGQGVAVTQDGLPACSVELVPAEATIRSDGDVGSFDVRTEPRCSWTATSAVGWITITSPREGAGNGTVRYEVERNNGSESRTGQIGVASRTFTVTQPPPAPQPVCDYSVAPVQVSVCMSVGFDVTTTVTTAPGCEWTTATDAPWISVTSASSRSGPGTVTLRVADNWDDPRTGVVMLRWPTITAGQNVRIDQAGCRYATSVSELTVSAAGGSSSFDVLQQSDPTSCGGPLQDRCLWTAASSAAWITITSATQQTGDGRVSFTAAANTTGAARSGQISVRDRTVLIIQPAQ
jgi:hypothetical protein